MEKVKLTGAEKERTDIARMINNSWNNCIGAMPPANDPMEIKVVHFKRRVTEELEKMYIAWEIEIRSEYENNPHWRYTKHLPKKNKTDIQGYIKE